MDLSSTVLHEDPFIISRDGLNPWEPGYMVIQDKDMYRYYKKLLEESPVTVK